MAKLLCETGAQVRLCRQRPPYLPGPKGDRAYATAIIDLITDGINHNLRKRLDATFYRQSLTILARLLAYLGRTRTKLPHHWSELWRSLLAFVRFLTVYVDDVKAMIGTSDMQRELVGLLTLALTTGESFLPDATAYDDLVYKLVESGDALVKFRDAYALSKPDETSPINTLISVSKHYQELIESQRAKKEHLSPREISKIIKQGYDTLSLEAGGASDRIEPYREADHKSELKKIARIAVVDAASLVAESQANH